MNPLTPPSVPPRRRIGRWIAFGLVLLLTPLLVLGVGVISMLHLDRDAAVLRREVMAASDAKWHTKVQMSMGWVTLGAVRTGMRFIEHENIEDARLALAAVRRASVGVYECTSGGDDLSLPQLFARTDKVMRQRGWTRLVGVGQDDETVLVYTSDDIGSGSQIDLCVAVVNGREMVVVSTKVDADRLTELATRHIPKDGLRSKLKAAKLSF
jgi:hypothetical protein